jgi:protein-tyrosine-phosphatase
MAEYQLRKMLKGREDVEVSSCGTAVLFPTTASHEAINVLKGEGLDASEHVSRPMTNMLLKKSDLIFVMTRSQRSQVLERVPAVEKRVYLIGEFKSGVIRHEQDLDIPDPMGKSHREYQECFEVLRDCLDKVLQLV